MKQVLLGTRSRYQYQCVPVGLLQKEEEHALKQWVAMARQVILVARIVDRTWGRPHPTADSCHSSSYKDPTQNSLSGEKRR